MKKFPVILLMSITLVLSSCSNFYNDLTENIKTVEYTVEHYQQTPDGKGYEILKSETKKQSGTANTKTKAEANEYTGFNVKEYSQQNISPDGNTVVKIYYDRKTITLSFDFDGGKDSGGQENLTISGLYGSVLSLPAPVKKGYLIEAWNPVVPETFPSENSSYAVLWKEGDTTYTVHHSLQNIEGTDYEEKSEDFQQIIGITNANTTASAKAYTGFTPKDFSQKTINSDGSTDISIYYNRNVYTYTFKSNSGNWNDNLNIRTIKTISGVYGSTVQSMESPIRTGYSFKNWDSDVPETYGAEDLIFNANWNANTDTAYTVEHWQQNIYDDEYTKIDSDSQFLTGITDTMTAASVKSYEGFTAKDFEQKNISGDNSTVIQIYYDRKTTSYTFNANNGAWNDNSTTQVVSGRYGKTVNISAPDRTGYHFSSWDNSVPLVFGVDNINFSANWIPNSDTIYKVEHWQQNINDDNYTQLTGDTQTLSGTTAENTNASAKTYAGFSAKNFSQEEIAADGSTVIKVYYDRNIINYTFSANGGNWSGSTANRTISGKFGAAVSAPSNPVCTGYTFSSWDQEIPSVFGKADASLPDTTFTAGWSANTDTRYTVEHWQQNMTGLEYTRVETDTQPLTGTTATQTDARAKNYTGFTAKDFNQGIIAPDGSTVIKVYYDRNKITYTFKPNGGNWNGSTAAKTQSGRFGAPVSAPSNPVKTGYTFGSWGETVPSVFGSTDKIFTTNWTPNTNTAYTVEHWQQNVTGSGYTKVEADTQFLTGTTDTSTAASAKSYTGFTAKAFSQKTIAGVGNTVVRIDYERNTITYTFNPNGGKWSGSPTPQRQSGRYGAPVTAPSRPVRTGYTFDSWDSTIPSTFGAENKTFSTKWIPNTNTKYTVEHWRQNINDDSYTKYSTQNLTGTTDASTAASANSYTGFTAKTFNQGTIAPDGNTVIKIYYDRNIIAYTFNAEDGKFSDNSTIKTISGRYGATVSKPVNPTPNHPRYMFDIWDITVPAKFGTQSLSVTAQYKYNFYETPVKLPSGTTGTAGTNWTYVYFGVYPKTIKPAGVTIDESNSIKMGIFTLYLGSDKDYYVKCKENAHAEDYTYSDGTLVAQSDADSYKYFRVEPIKWRVLTTNYNSRGKALLLAESIVDIYCYSIPSEEKPNNYENSKVRTFLNSEFLDSAFTSSAKQIIPQTNVVNSSRSTNPDSNAEQWNNGVNNFWCSTTYDKIFLLSEQEVTKQEYGFKDYEEKDSARKRSGNDYVKAKHIWANQINNCCWWLRSPNYGSALFSHYVNAVGVSGCNADKPINCNLSYLTPHGDGIVPALTISLP